MRTHESWAKLGHSYYCTRYNAGTALPLLRVKGGSELPEIRVTRDGPYLVSGELPIAKATIGANEDGESIRW